MPHLCYNGVNKIFFYVAQLRHSWAFFFHTPFFQSPSRLLRSNISDRSSFCRYTLDISLSSPLTWRVPICLPIYRTSKYVLASGSFMQSNGFLLQFLGSSVQSRQNVLRSHNFFKFSSSSFITNIEFFTKAY